MVRLAAGARRDGRKTKPRGGPVMLQNPVSLKNLNEIGTFPA